MIFRETTLHHSRSRHPNLTTLVCAMETPASSLGSAPWSKPNKRILVVSFALFWKMLGGEKYIKILRYQWLTIDYSRVYREKPAAHHEILDLDVLFLFQGKLNFTGRNPFLFNGSWTSYPKISWGFEWFAVITSIDGVKYSSVVGTERHCLFTDLSSMEFWRKKIKRGFKRDKTRLISK